MAEKSRERLKQSFLLVFIAFNVVLIFLVWADNLTENPGNQGFVRSTAAPSATSSGLTTGTIIPAPSQLDTPHKHATPIVTSTPYEDDGDVGMLHSTPETISAGT